MEWAGGPGTSDQRREVSRTSCSRVGGARKELYLNASYWAHRLRSDMSSVPGGVPALGACMASSATLRPGGGIAPISRRRRQSLSGPGSGWPSSGAQAVGWQSAGALSPVWPGVPPNPARPQVPLPEIRGWAWGGAEPQQVCSGF